MRKLSKDSKPQTCTKDFKTLEPQPLARLLVGVLGSSLTGPEPQLKARSLSVKLKASSPCTELKATSACKRGSYWGAF